MKLFNRFCWFALLIGIFIAVMMTCGGCGSKKKLTQKSQYSTEIAVVEKVNETKETENSTLNEIF